MNLSIIFTMLSLSYVWNKTLKGNKMLKINKKKFFILFFKNL